MAIDHANEIRVPRRRYGRRLMLLLGLNALLLALFVLSRLTPVQAKKLGPWGNSLYELINRPTASELSFSGRNFVAEIKGLGGDAHLTGRISGFMKLSVSTELFHIRLNGTEFGDEDLARLLGKNGYRISGLDLRNTNVTDQGLRHLKAISNLEQLVLGNEDMRGSPGFHRPTSPITDAGLVHLSELTKLRSLNLCGLPITDAGLTAISDLPNLAALYLSRTKVSGPGLARLKSLPRLVILYLDESAVTDEGLSHLEGASSLQLLSLNRVSLTAKGLKPLNALLRLRTLELTGCGLLDEEVDALRINKPGLKIKRR